MAKSKKSLGSTFSIKKIKRPSKSNHWSPVEGKLILESICKEFGLTLHAEYQFCPEKKRKYRFDYFIEEVKIGIEFDGGVWSREIAGQDGGHNSGTGITRDIEKGNYAQLCGFQWFRFTYQQTKAYFHDTIKQAIINKLKI